MPAPARRSATIPKNSKARAWARFTPSRASSAQRSESPGNVIAPDAFGLARRKDIGTSAVLSFAASRLWITPPCLHSGHWCWAVGQDVHCPIYPPDCPVGIKSDHGDEVRCTAALPPKAEVHPRSRYVAQVPTAAVSTRSRTAPYSITSSARACSEGGTVSPSILAALRVDDQFKLAGLN